MRWNVEFLNEVVRREVADLPEDIRARLEMLSRRFMDNGLTSLREPHAKHLEGRLWELRLKGRDGIARVFYVTATGRRIVLLRAFRKKSQKTPRRELDLARKRMKEVI